MMGVPLLLVAVALLAPAVVPWLAPALGWPAVRFGARHSGNPLVRAIYAPGLWLQSLTTRPPDRSMLEVSIASLESCLASDRSARGEEKAPPTAGVVDPTIGITP